MQHALDTHDCDLQYVACPDTLIPAPANSSLLTNDEGSSCYVALLPALIISACAFTVPELNVKKVITPLEESAPRRKEFFHLPVCERAPLF
jgi:hypothetical protein